MVNENYDFELASALFEKKSYEEVRRYVLAHANAGDSNAQCFMGFLCEHGFGAPPDVDEAERWLNKAAEQNNALAWNNLGTFWTLRDPKKSKLCFRRAVELGFTMAAPLAG